MFDFGVFLLGLSAAMRSLLRFITAGLLLLSRVGAVADLRAADAPTLERSEAVRLVEDLLNDDFATREAARYRLDALAADGRHASLLRAVAEARLAQDSVDFDGRQELTEFLRGLPADAPAAAPAGDARLTAAAVDALLRDLDAPQFKRRDFALAELLKAAERPTDGTFVMLRTKALLAETGRSPEFDRRLRAVWYTAWGAWLRRPPQVDALGEVSEAEVEATVDRLLKDRAAANAADARHGHDVARRELLYFLARDDALPRVRAALERRLQTAEAEPLTPGAAERLQEVYDWSRPAMVAEFWESGEHRAVQHLILGVPNQPAGAPNPSLFDRCDERTAHCVSGNSLSPGDWPVGVFFPHPASTQDGAQFHLKNLPTPRRRLAYEYEVPTNLTRERQLVLDGARRKEITRNTCRRWLEEKHLLGLRELDMLRVLDPEEVSLFAADYLTTVPDQRVPHDSPTSFGNGSSHGLFCYQLAMVGTAAAGPALQKAIEARAVLAPVEETPYRMDWVALLLVAGKYHWPGRDAWLAKHFDSREPINIVEAEAAEVGASAAAALVQVLGGSPSEFHLQRHSFLELIDLENPGFRFTSAEGREAVRRWAEQRIRAELPDSRP